MAYVTRQLPSFQGVSQGGTAVCELPIGLTYHTIILTAEDFSLDTGDHVASKFNEVRLIANGQPVMRWAGGRAFANYCAYEKQTLKMPENADDQTTDETFMIPFDRVNLISRRGIELTQYGSGVAQDPTPLVTFRLEIDLASDAGSSIKLSAKALQSAPSTLGYIKKIRNFNHNPSAGGDFEISDIPKTDLINRIFFISDSANATADHKINRVTLERDNFIAFERTAVENYQFIRDKERFDPDGFPYRTGANAYSYPGVPNSDGRVALYVFDPSEQGYSDQSITTANVSDLRFVVNLSASAHLQVVVEYIGVLEI